MSCDYSSEQAYSFQILKVALRGFTRPQRLAAAWWVSRVLNRGQALFIGDAAMQNLEMDAFSEPRDVGTGETGLGSLTAYFYTLTVQLDLLIEHKSLCESADNIHV